MYLRVSENRLGEVSLNVEFTVLFQRYRVMYVSLCVVSEAGGRCIWISEGLFVLESLESVVSLGLVGHVFMADDVQMMLSCNLQGRYKVCWRSPWDEYVHLDPKPSVLIYMPQSVGKVYNERG